MWNLHFTAPQALASEREMKTWGIK